MEIKEVLEFLFQRADANQTFWNFYSLAATTILGIVTATNIGWLRREARVGLIAVFIIFAVANFDSLDRVRRQRGGLVKMAEQAEGYRQETHGPILKAVGPSPKKHLVYFHGVLDIEPMGQIFILA